MNITRLNIRYNPWKVSAYKGKTKTKWAEISDEAAKERVAKLESEGWTDIKIIDGKAEEEAVA